MACWRCRRQKKEPDRNRAGGKRTMAIDSNGQTDLAVKENRYALRNRYVFRGKLVMQTALHIGGGRVTLSSSDSPVMLTPDQKPFIPGSSFKGALRSAVEKLASALPGFSTCALIEYTREAW